MLGEEYVERRGFHDYVLTRSERRLGQWLERGFTRVPREQLLEAISFAFEHHAPCSEYQALWTRLFPWTPLPALLDAQGIVLELVNAARASTPLLYVLERRIERGIQLDAPVFKAPPVPPRTTTEHFIVIEAVRDTEAAEPVPGVRLELLIADGEIKTAHTDARGVARVERIAAGRVVIRVLDVDGTLWRPLEGEPARPSSPSRGLRWHTAQRGECLSRIAHAHGLPSWTTLWEHPKNARLRQKRRSPHVLYPGDQVAVPGVELHEIVRPTDQTHRIALDEALVEFRVILQDHNQLPYRNVPYELRVGESSDAPRAGATDHDGQLVEQLSAATRRVEVFLPGPRLRWSFELGALLDIPDEDFLKSGPDAAARALAVEALQTRLLALGFPCGPVDGRLGPRTHAALSLWRAQQPGIGASGPDAEAPSAEKELDHALLVQLDAAYEVMT